MTSKGENMFGSSEVCLDDVFCTVSNAKRMFWSVWVLNWVLTTTLLHVCIDTHIGQGINAGICVLDAHPCADIVYCKQLSAAMAF